jgi:cytidine deaminase
LNRNYGVDWGIEDSQNMDRRALKDTDGACVDPCGECYKGINAFSEKET